MLERLTDKDLLIKDSLQFLILLVGIMDMLIVFGSDQNKLIFLSEKLEITRLFQSINGSPNPKSILVSELIQKGQLDPRQIHLIEDSINYLEAVKKNEIHFVGYNDIDLRSLGVMDIHSFTLDFQ